MITENVPLSISDIKSDIQQIVPIVEAAPSEMHDAISKYRKDFFSGSEIGERTGYSLGGVSAAATVLADQPNTANVNRKEAAVTSGRGEEHEQGQGVLA